ncbi:ribosomal protein S18 acetylase RimI-like enzyme [Phyllobacterium trifolii]|jgi:ribosomal protein S18 acetylase RimI-like enzyme|uniref:Ribosomal protein S18 acetylase RimI-like enzyme n=1 Tax=Phyllobacterium trifolii TaxID=300193 RepID=A0A839U9C3_9HYPH|nr:GNAT family N-acetyltransferase [Phyllobacterium trifolii]MBB3147127.1 ribosomal protein S18 acetylase RimI-like enzyme [Phyllobacterium trifolii]
MVRAATPFIRILDGADAEAFHALRLHGLRSAPEAFGSSYEEERELGIEDVRRRLDDQPNAVFGAFADDVLVGIAGFAMNTKSKQRHKGLLWGVFVDKDWRGHNLGKRLTEAVIDYARGHVDTLHATVMATNISARALYLGLGFTVFGFEKDALRVNDQSYDDELLRLDLR